MVFAVHRKASAFERIGSRMVGGWLGGASYRCCLPKMWSGTSW